MSQSLPQPVTAFSPEYLTALREQDEPATAADPEIVGPWKIWERDGMFHIFREWERFEAGHQPVASFKLREDAFLFAAALRACVRPMTFRIQSQGASAPEGYRVERDGELVGYLKTDLPSSWWSPMRCRTSCALRWIWRSSYNWRGPRSSR